MVFRYIELIKEWKLELMADDKEEIMHNASEEISGIEVARAYLMPGEKTQIDYHKHSWVDGKDYWDDCNLYGNANITIHAGRILPHTYREMREPYSSTVPCRNMKKWPRKSTRSATWNAAWISHSWKWL